MNIYQLLYNIYLVSMTVYRIASVTLRERLNTIERIPAHKPLVLSLGVNALTYGRLTQLSNFRLPTKTPKMNMSSIMTAMDGKALLLAALAFSTASIRISVSQHSQTTRRS
jgi:hypothetical protein